MCAIAAGKRGRRVVVLESANKIGKKILMSGGGRCNFTNLHCSPANYLSANPHFCISALSRYTQWDFIALVEQHGIAYHDKGGGQLFCDDSSKDILGMLEAECENAGVEILTHCDDAAVAFDNGYCVKNSKGVFTGDSLVIATGGLSIPKMGATDFGLNVVDTRAGLVPFTFTGAMHELTDRLSGISLPATVTASGNTFTDDILFTHRGLSGPASLQASSYWSPGEDIALNLLPSADAEGLLTDAKIKHPKALLRTILSEHLPRALVLELQELFWPDVMDQRVADIADSELRRIGSMLQEWMIRPASTEGYRTAEVTLGGIDTDELSSQTMECKRQSGLFCIGEVIDVTGHLGGFNFQWAWASAQAAGQVV
jgi:predicted Rossmann fold flavoprotein